MMAMRTPVAVLALGATVPAQQSPATVSGYMLHARPSFGMSTGSVAW